MYIPIHVLSSLRVAYIGTFAKVNVHRSSDRLQQMLPF